MSYDHIVENVPDFVRRVGDRVMEGSNNVLMVLGTDRPSGLDSGLGHINSAGGGKGTGTWHVVAGRSGEDPNFASDKSFIYLSMKTDVDVNLGLGSIEEATNATPAVVLKSDSVRIVARKDLKISVGKAFIFMKSDGTIVLDGPNIRLGSGAVERLVKGDSFMALYNAHTHPTAVGPSGPPVKPMTAAQLSSRKAFVS
jgi:hypothetical protein